MQENGSQRAAKIARSYHTARDPFIYRKRWMGLIGLCVGVICTLCLFYSSNGAVHVTPGELSQPHYAWNNTGCENCHTPYVPIRKDAFGGDLVANISKNNKQCNSTCHTVSGHFEAKTIANVLAKESCSTCHREHLGFDRSLVEVSNKDCSRCHADLPSVAVDPAAIISGGNKTVSNFSEEEGHPKFASLAEPDPGTIRFSHAQHLRPGQPKSPNGADAKKFEMLPEKFHDRYKDRVDANRLIQLTCSDCHARDVELNGYENLESASSKQNTAIQSTSHMLFKPVEFDKHCAACHDLDGVPHGLDRNQMKQAISELSPLKTLEYLKTRFKGPELDGLAEGKLSKEMEEEIAGRKIRLKAILDDGGTACQKCHQQSNDAKSIVAPSNLKQKWLRNASFTHGAHLMVSCKDCHPNAYASSDDVFDWEQIGNTNSKVAASEVMIPNIEKCRECHIPDAQKRSRTFGTIKQVATADCVDCHRYHIDPPMKSQASGAASLSEVHRFLENEKSP